MKELKSISVVMAELVKRNMNYYAYAVSAKYNTNSALELSEALTKIVHQIAADYKKTVVFEEVNNITTMYINEQPFCMRQFQLHLYGV